MARCIRLLIVAAVLGSCCAAFSQQTLRRFCLGTQFTAMQSDATFISGLGPAFTVNLTKNFALDGTISFFPKARQGADNYTGGRPFQALVGIKAGVSGRRYGFFAKARPGIVSWSRAITDVQFNNGMQQPSVTFGRRTYLAFEIGGGVEYFVSDRVTLRGDVGDNYIHYTDPRLRGSRFTDTVQTSAGVYYRLGRPVLMAEPNNTDKHRFFDRTNIALLGTMLLAQSADAVTTQHLQSRNRLNESNPLARPFVRQGWAGQIAAGVVLDSVVVGIQYGLHRLGHHRLERIPPLVPTIGSGTAAYHNAQNY